MSSKGLPLRLNDLLPRVAQLLTQCTLPNDHHPRSLHPELTLLTEQLRNTDLVPQHILEALIGDSTAETRVRVALWEAVRGKEEACVLVEKWSGLKQQTRQNYSILESSINTLTKEVLQNINLILEEQQHLAHNINALPPPLPPLPPLPLYALLRLAMDDGNASFPNHINELIFRLYILEESTVLVLLKARRVAEQLTIQLNDESDSRRSSLNTERTGNTKRSALSESLAVFKRRQLREQLERSDLLPQLLTGRETQIQSDYRMSPRKVERKGREKRPTKIACCFRF